MQIHNLLKRIYLCLIITLLPLVSYGQSKMSVSDFYLDEKDLDANTEGTLERDQNGDKCALIKIKTTEKGFSFENGSLGVVKTDESKVAEVWVYLPHGSKRLDIKHPELGEINYEFPMTVKKAKTYVMKLTTDKVFTATFDDNKFQKLILHITPSKAKVKINGSIENVEDGKLEKEYSFGRYRYIVSADRYHDHEDTITINNPNAPQERTIHLKQAFGWLKFDNFKDLGNARLYVDFENNMGLITSEPFSINSGSHTLKIVKPLYENYEQEFIISDSVTTTLSPVMVKNFAVISLECVDKNAEIWIDDVKKAIGAYTDSLGAGTHKIECRKKYHTSTFQEIKVVKDVNSSYTLDAPVPICGSIIINTSVPAQVVVDNNPASSPSREYRNDKVLIGEHKVIVRQKGYKTQTFDLTLAGEGDSFKRDIVMEPIINVSFESNPSGSVLYVDREKVGSTPVSIELKSGKHNVQILHNGYYSYNGDEKFNEDGKKFYKKLRRIYYHNTDFYMEGFAQAGTFMAYGAAMGAEIYGFNIEAFYKGGFDKETVYASSMSSDDNSSVSDAGVPTLYDFKVKLGYGGKIGYAINLHNRWRITPQVGAGYSEISSGDSYSSETTYVLSGLANIKFQFALCQNVSLTLSPEYSMALSKGKLYEKLAEISTKIKGWGDGFNCSLGLNIFF